MYAESRSLGIVFHMLINDEMISIKVTSSILLTWQYFKDTSKQGEFMIPSRTHSSIITLKSIYRQQFWLNNLYIVDEESANDN